MRRVDHFPPRFQQQTLGLAKGGEGTRGHLTSALEGRLPQGLARNEALGETDLDRTLSAQEIRAEEDLRGPAGSHPKRQQRGAGGLRHDAELNEGGAKPRARGDVDDIAMQREREAEADGDPIDSGEERLVELA